MDIAILFPFLLLIGVMYLMTRSARNRQRQAMEMRDSMEPGAGIRTIGGMYALVKEVREDTVLVEITPGVHAIFAKNAIGAVLEADEYHRIVSDEPAADDTPAVPDDASALTGQDAGADGGRVGLEKQGDAAEDVAEDADTTDGTKPGDPRTDGENGPR